MERAGGCPFVPEFIHVSDGHISILTPSSEGGQGQGQGFRQGVPIADPRWSGEVAAASLRHFCHGMSARQGSRFLKVTPELSSSGLTRTSIH